MMQVKEQGRSAGRRSAGQGREWRVIALAGLIAGAVSGCSPKDPGHQAAASAPAAVPSTAGSALAAQQDLTFKKTMAEAKAAQAAYDSKSAGGRFLQRVENEYLPRVAAISTTTPDTNREIFQRLDEVDALIEELKTGLAQDPDADQKKGADKLKAALAAKQAKLFPVLRDAFRDHMRQGLWEQDIKVLGSGKRIELIGVRFASNAYIKAAMDGMESGVERLRFKTVTFRWIPDGEGAIYRLDDVPDTQVLRPSA